MRGEKVLVTGAGGFVGSWLVPRLRRAGHEVVGVNKPGVPVPELGIDWIETDLRDADAVDALIEEQRPTRLLHLAGIAVVSAARADPLEALRVNVHSVLHLLRALAAHAPRSRTLLVSTGAVYPNQSADAAPHTEETALAPASVYAATKAAAEALAVGFAREQGLYLIRARPFNHTGPGRPPDYAEGAFARQIVRIERGQQDPLIRVGNLEAMRDFSDVRDVVSAYLLLMERGESGAVYNIASGQARSIRSVLDLLLAHSNAQPEVEVDPELYRGESSQQIALAGDASRLRNLGWTARFSLKETLGELLDDYRARA